MLTAQKLYKLMCLDCGAIMVTSNPEEHLHHADEYDYYLCDTCEDTRKAE